MKVGKENVREIRANFPGNRIGEVWIMYCVNEKLSVFVRICNFSLKSSEDYKRKLYL